MLFLASAVGFLLSLASLLSLAATVVGDMAPFASVVIMLFKSEVSVFLQPAKSRGIATIVKYKNNLFIFPPYRLIPILYIKQAKRNINYKLDFAQQMKKILK